MAQDMNHIWELCGLGSATSEGYKEKARGSGHIFAYGLCTSKGVVPSVDIAAWNGEKRTISPVTKEAIATALDAMAITETAWTL